MSEEQFTYDEALELWSRLIAGWARSLDASGARTCFDGVLNSADAGGSYEGVTRMLWGLGGWLARPERPAVLRWQSEHYDLEALTRRALIAGTDPHNRASWWRGASEREYDQRTVESGQVAFAAWQTRDRIWARLEASEQENLLAWLERFGRRPAAWHNNWALFWALNHAGRKALGARYEQATLDSALDYLERVYCGDGWYDDGPARGVNHFDDYNWLVFTTHVLAWEACDGHTQPERRARLLERVRLAMERMPYFFAADGAYAEYGRSLSYKFARLGAPLMAYRAGCWPHGAGMLRRLVGRHLRWYIDRGALRADGALRQELTAGGSSAVRETYISTGAPYWAMLAFAGLWQLADNDPFWTVAEEALPVERGDFVRVFPQPGWVLSGKAATGHVQRFNAGATGAYPAKYDKFVYASSAPFNVGLADGQPSPDSMLCLTDERGVAHRSGNDAWTVGEPGWLRMRYRQLAAGGLHLIDTTLVVRGELHLRAHRITIAQGAGPVGVLEGPPPLGYPPGTHPLIQGDTTGGWEYAASDQYAVAIVRVRGYSSQRAASAWGGRADLNSVYSEHVLPLLVVERLEPISELVCLVYTGAPLAEPLELAMRVHSAQWEADGTLRLVWSDGVVIDVPPLPSSGSERGG
jgi:hypothetical protein